MGTPSTADPDEKGQREEPIKGNQSNGEEAISSSNDVPFADDLGASVVECLCPRGHLLRKYDVSHDSEDTCDVCLGPPLEIGAEVLVCELCNNFAVCGACTERLSCPEHIEKTRRFGAGMGLFQERDYAAAVEEFKQAKDSPLGPCAGAFSNEILAKAQYLMGDTDAAFQSCSAATACYEALGEEWKDEMAKTQKLEEDMKLLCREAKMVPSEWNSEALKLLGVSVHHLQTTFMAQLRVANLDKASSIHDIESLEGRLGVIRGKGANFVCPVDGLKKASYVHCLEGSDHVGMATHILSYCWRYSIGDVIDSLSDFCDTHDLDPKRQYIWIDCLCINQHRVVEQKEIGGTGMLNFEKEFPLLLKRIGHMLVMMAPWKAPIYLSRIWCIFELYTAHTQGCKIDVIMPTKEKESLKEDVVEEGRGINSLYMALGNTKVQNAEASVESDKQTILQIVEASCGHGDLNDQVNDLLRAWMKRVLMQLVEAREDSSSERHASFCYKIGIILEKNGDYDAALGQYSRSLATKETLWGKGHPTTAVIYCRIGSVMNTIGKYDAALVQYRRCLAIEEALLGEDNPDTAVVHQHIGSVLRNKGDLEGALCHYEKCLAVQSMLGDHNDYENVSAIHTSIGSVLQAKGDHDGAIEHYQKSLAIEIEAHSPDHPAAAAAHHSLGSALHDKGDYDGALEQYNKCLSIREHLLGKSHPDTANTYAGMGMALREKGGHSRAMEHYKKCLPVFEAVLGKDHPNTKACMDSMASLKEALKSGVLESS